jgi:Ca2+-binding EF-hand superfamily protein
VVRDRIPSVIWPAELSAGRLIKSPNPNVKPVMKPNKILLVTALVLSTSALAFSAPAKGKPSGPPVPPEILAKYDTDGDGKLSETEKAAMKADLEAKRQALIAKYDTNGDGVLDATERAAAEAAIQAERLAAQKAKFVTLDTDTSGGLSLAEFTAGAPTGATAAKIAAAFARLDTNKDSSLSVDEFTAKPAKPTPPDVAAKFASLDTDLSGGLSLAEFTSGAPKGATAAQIQSAFTKVDADADGSITLTEFSAAPPPPAKGGKPAKR